MEAQLSNPRVRRLLGEPLGVMSYGNPSVDECVVLHFNGQQIAIVPTRQNVRRVDGPIGLCIVSERSSIRVGGHGSWQQRPQHAPEIVFARRRAAENWPEFAPESTDDSEVICGLLLIETLRLQHDST